jgi:hypothetical protein
MAALHWQQALSLQPLRVLGDNIIQFQDAFLRRALGAEHEGVSSNAVKFQAEKLRTCTHQPVIHEKGQGLMHTTIVMDSAIEQLIHARFLVYTCKTLVNSRYCMPGLQKQLPFRRHTLWVPRVAWHMHACIIHMHAYIS